jgi:acyl-coenzyme A synthetase/AMP-(fatty) acid ligase
VSFAGLDQSARAVAEMLRRGGAARGDLLAFRMGSAAAARHRVLYLATQLAAFRLGCALLPIGQHHPPELARAQIERLGAYLVIDTTPALDCSSGWAAGAEREDIPGFDGATLTIRGVGASAALGVAEDTAVVLTTSGTTGTPKAVCLSQEVLLGFLHGAVSAGTLPAMPWLMGANIGFDMALGDVWLSWVYGRHVVLLEDDRRTPTALAKARELGARVVSLSPTIAAVTLREDAGAFAGYCTLLLMGEILPRSLAQSLAEHAAHLVVLNGYGPSETAILATLSRVEAVPAEGPLPLGPALAGYRVLIADPVTLAALPPYWPGELLVAPAAVASGYTDRQMTSARFTELAGEAPGPFFRSGDLGWIDERGEVHFLGRNDRQVKIAGVRVELDGVEHVIDRVPGVEQVGAIVVEANGAARVVAVVQSAPAVADRGALRDRILAYCREWLPRAAIPANVVFTDAMPTGGSG